MRQNYFLLLLLVILLVPGVGAAATPDSRVYVLIVANNSSLDESTAPLRFADDDGVRYFELFSNYADETALFSVLDEDTQRLHRGVASEVRPPTQSAIQAKLRSYFDAMRRDQGQGLDSIFYFIYSGHGDIGENREGYVNFQDARFTRSDLYEQVIGASPATYNHIIIDACNSYFMVSSRGEWRNDRVDTNHSDLLAMQLTGESLSRYPNTGVLLSTSSAQETHEWSAYRAGVFSHELRSGLVGSADVNRDGRIEYSEIKAYVAAANSMVDDPKARVNLYGKPPPANLSVPIFDINRMRVGHYLELGANDAGHYYLEDPRGLRYADFNKALGQPLRIALLPRDYYYLRQEQREARIPLTTPGVFPLSKARWHSLAMAARGSTSESFRRNLFNVAYGPSFYYGYVANHGGIPVVMRERESGVITIVPPASESSLKTWRWVGLGVTAAAGVGAVVAGLRARDSYNEFEREFESQGTANRSRENEVRDRRRTTNILIGTAAVAGATTLVLFLLAGSESTDESSAGLADSPTIGVTALDGGAALLLSGGF